ncbi:hypothetical protein DCC39_16645 [Pueribacillus theae]|uniref:YdbS-like PH domain-containing protein n=1 Tax=Pueribacillus theae TaxID=2171751 RepID=A0A2U1JRT2_9BACI|nr:PH domain-containing protein [Pueribacillus theae]PWA07528.1 hypothetical protein DCC39_16645 [Pueribacillus theae]
MKKKRYHPLLIFYDLWGYVKSVFFLILILAFNYKSQTFFMKYGRYAFYLYTAITIIYFILKWFTHQYKLGDTAFHLYKGIFNKQERTIPYSKIQNVNRHTSKFHRLFKVTSIHFETAMQGDDATVKFEVISPMQADQMEAYIANCTHYGKRVDEAEPIVTGQSQDEKRERTVHFHPTRRDVIKASFTSLSFLVLVPILVTFYFKVNEFLNLEERAEGFISTILSAWWLTAIMIILLVIASIIFGMARVYLKYGKYEISSDEERIYITQGVIDETSFSILKGNVQAIEINQSLMKRILGIVEVKLISAGNLKIDDDKLEISSLYPFLPEKRAYEMIAEILPSFEITEDLFKLPKKSLWVRLLRPIWFLVLASVALAYFKPAIFGIQQAWWIGIIILFIVIYVYVILSYKNTKYTLNDKFIQIKKGGIATSQFISKRDKIIEVKVSRSIFQRKLGIASIEIVNRANPVRHTGLDDIPVAKASSFYTWYMDRTKEIEVE